MTNRKNKIFIAASLANGASFSMILPLLAPLIRQLKLSEIQAGAMVSVGALLMAIAAIYISKHQNKFSIYQLLSIGFVGMAITWGLFTAILMYGLNTQLSLLILFILLMVARASTGIFMAMPQIALQSYVMTSFSDEKTRSQTMSKFGALNSLGLILGPLMTTVLLYWGILTPLWAAVIILLIMSVMIVFLFDQSSSIAGSEQHQVHNKSIKNIIIEADHNQQVDVEVDAKTDWNIKKCYPWLSLGFSLYLAIVTLNLTAGFYIQDKFQVSVEQVAVYFAQCSLIVGVALVFMQILISKYLKWTLQRLLWVGLSSMVLALMITLFTDQLIVFQLTYVLYGISVACLLPAFTTGAAQTAPNQFQTKVASFCTATQAISFVVGPLLSTGLYQINQSYPYYLLIMVMCIMMVYFAVQHFKLTDQLRFSK